MVDLNGFNANEIEPSRSFDPLPPGKYTAVITGSEWKKTKSNNGAYLEFTFQIIEGPHAGRQLWDRLNLENPNQLAVKIAKSELSSICRAVGVLTPKDSVELHNIPLVVTVKQKTGPDGEIRNEITAYSAKKAAPKPVQTNSFKPP